MSVIDDLNNTDFTGHPRATADGALWLSYADTMVFRYGRQRYLWVGSRGLTVGVNGSHDAVDADLLLLSSLDHFDFSNVGNYTHAEIDAHIDDPDPHVGHVSEGGTGLYLSVPAVPVDPTIGDVPELVEGFDTVESPQIDAIASTANSSVTFLESGFWLVGVALAAQIVPITSNNAAAVALAFYNITDGVQGQTIAYSTIPRYGETISMSAAFRVGITTAMVGKEFGLVLWRVHGPGAAIDTTLVELLEFWCARVGHKSVNPVGR